MQTASIVLERHTAARIWSRHLIAREGIWNPILALSMRFEQISENTLTRIRSNWGAPTNPMTQTCWQMHHVSPNPSCDLERWWCYFHLFRCSRCHKPNAKFNAYIWKLGPCDCNAASLILSTRRRLVVCCPKHLVTKPTSMSHLYFTYFKILAIATVLRSKLWLPKNRTHEVGPVSTAISAMDENRNLQDNGVVEVWWRHALGGQHI